MPRRSGFTLIELVVAMALLMVFIAIAFGTLSNYYGAKSANEQEMIVEQNFRTAISRMTYDFVQSASHPVIAVPLDNSVSQELTFTMPNGSMITYSLEKDVGAGTCYVKKSVGTGAAAEPITEVIRQLVDLYFVRSGGKITVILVGRATYFGSQRAISFASMLVSRNYYIPNT